MQSHPKTPFAFAAVWLALGGCGSGGTSASAPFVAAMAGARSEAGAGGAGMGGTPAAVSGSAGRRAPPDQTGRAGSAAMVAMAGRTAPQTTNRSSAATSGSAAGSAAPPASAMMTTGCGKAPSAAGMVNLDVDGMARLYIVDVPSDYNNTTPYRLVMAFHGAGLAAASFKSFFKLTPAVGGEAIVAYLEALGDPTGWEYKRDMPYFDAVLAQLKSQYCIDESRVFATGHSSGGYFTNALGCQRGGVLRAIGPFSGGAAFTKNCEDKVAAWISHGNMDNIVPTMEGRAARDLWAKQSGCDTSQSLPVEPAPCVTYAGCDATNSVHYCEYDGDHNLPKFGVQAVWSFFKAL